MSPQDQQVGTDICLWALRTLARNLARMVLWMGAVLAVSWASLGMAQGDALTQSAAAPVEQLGEDELDVALEAIWAMTGREGAGSPLNTKRAALEGLLGRIGPGTSLVSKAVEKLALEKASSLRAEAAGPSVRWIVMGTLTPVNVKALAEELRGAAKVPGVVLDLRYTPPAGTLAHVAEVVSYFAPKGALMFEKTERETGKVEKLSAGRDPVYSGRVAVMVSTSVGGPAEVLAGALQSVAGAVVFGQKTRGVAGEFEDRPLGSDKYLRLRKWSVSVPELGDLSQGVRPDLQTSPPTVPDIALAIADRILAPAERARVVPGEGVARSTPELDRLIEDRVGRRVLPNPVPRDPSLQRAVDVLTALDQVRAPKR